jgi:hypothetical protein
MVGSVSSILTNRGNIVAATLQRTFVKIHSAIKISILLLYWDRPAEENHPLEKPNSTLKVFVDSPTAVLQLVVPRSVAPQPEASVGLLVAVFRDSFLRLSLLSQTFSNFRTETTERSTGRLRVWREGRRYSCRSRHTKPSCVMGEPNPSIDR